MSDIINWNNDNSDIVLEEEGINNVVAKASLSFWDKIRLKIDDFVKQAFDTKNFVTAAQLNDRTVVETIDIMTTTTRPIFTDKPIPTITVVDAVTGEVVSVSIRYLQTQVVITLSEPVNGVIRHLMIIYKY